MPLAEDRVEDPVLVGDQLRFPRPMTLTHTHAEFLLERNTHGPGGRPSGFAGPRNSAISSAIIRCDPAFRK